MSWKPLHNIFYIYILILFIYLNIMSIVHVLLTNAVFHFTRFVPFPCCILYGLFSIILLFFYSLFFCTIFVFYTFLSIFYCIIKERTFGLVSTFLHLPFLFSFPKVDSSYFHLNRLLKFLYFGLKFLFYLISFLLNFLIHTSLSWLHNQLVTLLLTANSQ